MKDGIRTGFAGQIKERSNLLGEILQFPFFLKLVRIDGHVASRRVALRRDASRRDASRGDATRRDAM